MLRQVDIELPADYASAAISLLNERKGNMIDMTAVTKEGGQVRY